MKTCYKKYCKFYTKNPTTEQQQAINKALLANIVEDIVGNTDVSKDKLLTPVNGNDGGVPNPNKPYGTLLDFILDGTYFKTDDQGINALKDYINESIEEAMGMKIWNSSVIYDRIYDFSLWYSDEYGCYLYNELVLEF